MTQAYDQLYHKGHFVTLQQLAKRFYWPYMSTDIKRHIQTCHTCQVFQYTIAAAEPSVEVPTVFFKQVYMDVMYMPKGTKNYIIATKDGFTLASEGQAIKNINSTTIARFI